MFVVPVDVRDSRGGGTRENVTGEKNVGDNIRLDDDWPGLGPLVLRTTDGHWFSELTVPTGGRRNRRDAETETSRGQYVFQNQIVLLQRPQRGYKREMGFVRSGIHSVIAMHVSSWRTKTSNRSTRLLV